MCTSIHFSDRPVGVKQDQHLHSSSPSSSSSKFIAYPLCNHRFKPLPPGLPPPDGQSLDMWPSSPHLKHPKTLANKMVTSPPNNKGRNSIKVLHDSHNIHDVLTWMKANRLLLNYDKTEVLWCSSSRRQHQIPTYLRLQPGRASIPRSPCANTWQWQYMLVKQHCDRYAVYDTAAWCRSDADARASSVRSTTVTLWWLEHRRHSCVASSRFSIPRLDWSVLPASTRAWRGCCASYTGWRCRNGSISGCVLMHHGLHEGEPAHLAESVRRTSSRNIRRHTRSTDTVTTLVPPTKRSTLGDRAFPEAAARAWNALPARVRSETSVSIFLRQLNTYLFHVSFPEQSKQTDNCYSNVTFCAFLSHFILFLYFCTVVLQQLMRHCHCKHILL